MRMCQRHWDMLRDEVESQGMGEWIIRDAETSMAALASEFRTGETMPTNFDPLMRCNWMIMNQAIEIAGLAAMAEDFGCPICEFNGQRTEDGRCKCSDPYCGGKAPGSIPDHETWLVGPESCVAAVRNMMIEKGWLKA